MADDHQVGLYFSFHHVMISDFRTTSSPTASANLRSDVTSWRRLGLVYFTARADKNPSLQLCPPRPWGELSPETLYITCWQPNHEGRGSRWQRMVVSSGKQSFSHFSFVITWWILRAKRTPRWGREIRKKLSSCDERQSLNTKPTIDIPEECSIVKKLHHVLKVTIWGRLSLLHKPFPSVCEFCEKESIAFAILDTWTEPKWKQSIQYVCVRCLEFAIDRKILNREFQYAPYWLVMRGRMKELKKRIAQWRRASQNQWRKSFWLLKTT